MDPSSGGRFGNVTRWFNTIVNQPQVKAVIGQVKLCVIRRAAARPGGRRRTTKKKDAQEEGRAPSRKRWSRRRSRTRPRRSPPPSPSSKDPFAGLPKSSWDIEDFKAVPLPRRGQVDPIWEVFDKENYSIGTA